MKKRRAPLTAEQAARVQKLRDDLSAANSEVLLPRLAADASTRLRAAGLPSTFEELSAIEEYSDGKWSGIRWAHERIRKDRTIPAPLRCCANIVFHTHELLKLTDTENPHGRAAGNTFWHSAILFSNLLAVTLDDDPLRQTGARTRKASATANAAKARQADADREQIRVEYLAEKAAHPRRYRGVLCSAVAARTGFGDRKVRDAVADLGPRNRKK